MLFSSSVFLFIFLPSLLLCYHIIPNRYKNLLLLSGSYFFYAWGEPKVVLILLLTTLIDYFVGTKIGKTNNNETGRKCYLALGVLINIAFLGYYKYANFFVSEAGGLLQTVGISTEDWQHIALPIGISFFTFQKLSYLVDVYRRTTEPAKNIIDFSLYVSLFPQLIAGPIIRYHDINQQLTTRSYAFENVGAGFTRFALGFGKKVLIANPLAAVADKIFDLPMESLSGGYIWLGILAYSFQIYFDFSGYSDMAIGLGRMFGFRFLENFNRPYIAHGITDFWRRWHISLSNWMREYLYIPLGGNRKSSARTYLNLWIVFLISGFWHGASWNFIVWGGIHGALLMAERIIGFEKIRKISPWFMQPATFFLVMISWLFFRVEDLSSATTGLVQMFSFSGFLDEHQHTSIYEIVSHRTWFIIVIAGIISFAPKSLTERIPLIHRPSTKSILACIVFTLALMKFADTSYNPFIYFRF